MEGMRAEGGQARTAPLPRRRKTAAAGRAAEQTGVFSAPFADSAGGRVGRADSDAQQDFPSGASRRRSRPNPAHDNRRYVMRQRQRALNITRRLSGRRDGRRGGGGSVVDDQSLQ